jgi:hypothetical protein
MRENESKAEKWLWGAVPIIALFAARVYHHVNEGIFSRIWLDDILLVFGWAAGWFLADADHLFYALVSNPHEMTSQRILQEIKNRNWKKILEIINDTKSERTQLPIRNVLTAFVMMGVGLWVISSSASLLAAGLCLGFSVRLFSEILADKNFKNWYWLFAREFSQTEHWGVILAWGAVLIWQFWILIRG